MTNDQEIQQLERQIRDIESQQPDWKQRITINMIAKKLEIPVKRIWMLIKLFEIDLSSAQEAPLLNDLSKTYKHYDISVFDQIQQKIQDSCRHRKIAYVSDGMHCCLVCEKIFHDDDIVATHTLDGQKIRTW